jgi:hypothetical protein
VNHDNVVSFGPFIREFVAKQNISLIHHLSQLLDLALGDVYVLICYPDKNGCKWKEIYKWTNDHMNCDEGIEHPLEIRIPEVRQKMTVWLNLPCTVIWSLM